MQTIARTTFTTVRTEGGLLPADLLQRIADGRAVEGLRPEDYHLLPGERLNEAINRAWNRCLGAWLSFDEQRRALSPTDTGTTLTRERWLLVLFQELGYGRLQVQRGGLSAPDGASYPISHLWENTAPIHLVTFRQPLDKRSDLATQVKRSPHSLMQEFLNRTPAYQWGIIANGLQLRLLRDNASLRRAAYVEFDLEAMMTGELYAEFSLLWLVCHQSRVEPRAEEGKTAAKAPAAEEDEEEAETVESARTICWLETWSKLAADQGTRALDALRDGVAETIQALGSGFLAHQANTELRRRLQAGDLAAQGYYQQLRRLVYRLIFLCVAEDRDLLLLPGADAATRRRHLDYYSLRRLRAMASTLRGGPHADLYRQLRLLFVLLREGYPGLGLPGLGSFLFSDHSTPDLDGLELANRDLLDALRALTFTVQNNVRRAVDYRNLDSEELGSVYESLLELHPQVNVAAATFALVTGVGSERKTTGSHYTPTSLVECLLDSALEPVVADRLKTAEETWRKTGDRRGETLRALQEQAILAIKVLDFASGSGHMLIGVGRRLARHLARIRTGDDEPTPDALRTAMRDVVRHCLYGVDVNDMAVELCKVALWMETLEPGKPLSFLDKNIQCGNSLIGVTPGLDIGEVPDDAFQPQTGDDRTTATGLRRRNRKEREGQLALQFGGDEPQPVTARYAGWRAKAMATLAAQAEDALDQVAAKESAYTDYLAANPYKWSQLENDLWTAAFFWPIPEADSGDLPAPTQAVLRDLRAGKTQGHEDVLKRVRRIARRHQFFHWALQFPEAFDREQGGFDVMLSNPPWERIKLQEKEWFATRHPAIANAPNAAARRRMIEALADEDPALYKAFLRDRRAAECESHYVRNSGKYPLCGRGDVNTYAVFAELARQVLSPVGRAGVIVPSGIATDDTTKFYFQDIMESRALASLYDFENREAIFPGVHRSYKFCLLTLTGERRPAPAAEFVFFALDTADLRDDWRRIPLTAQEIALLSPNTRTCPVFRSRRDAELTKTIYRVAPALVDEGAGRNPWAIRFTTMFHSGGAAHLFEMASDVHEESRYRDKQPLYEARLFHRYDHRFASYDVLGSTAHDVPEHQCVDPFYRISGRIWIDKRHVQQFYETTSTTSCLIAFRKIARSTDERTAIFAVLPRVGALDSVHLVLSDIAPKALLAGFLGNSDAFVFDFVLRQTLGGANFNFFVAKQLPFLCPAIYGNSCIWSQEDNGPDSVLSWVLPRVLELTYTGYDLQPFARDCGYDGPPFRWDEERRFLLRCELDAAYFHLYSIARDDVDYIMESFPIVKRKDVAKHNEYRTKRVILEIYDEMAAAMRTGVPYQTRLDPPPADPRLAHPAQSTP